MEKLQLVVSALELDDVADPLFIYREQVDPVLDILRRHDILAQEKEFLADLLEEGFRAVGDKFLKLIALGDGHIGQGGRFEQGEALVVPIYFQQGLSASRVSIVSTRPASRVLVSGVSSSANPFRGMV